MLSKYVVPGNKVEIRSTAERIKCSNEAETRKTYHSVVFDVLSEDRLEIYMPMEKTKLVLLSVGDEYDLYFYTATGLYECIAKVVDRYKTDNKYVVVFDILSNLRKYQRREYYRLNCSLDMESRLLRKEEIAALEGNDEYLIEELPLKKSIIVDISGGGMRFVGDAPYDAESLIYCKYSLYTSGKKKEYEMVARIIAVKKLEEKGEFFEHRAQFVNINMAEREAIIRFIFEEERKHRRKEKDME